MPTGIAVIIFYVHGNKNFIQEGIVTLHSIFLLWQYTEVHGVVTMLFLLLGWLFCFLSFCPSSLKENWIIKKVSSIYYLPPNSVGRSLCSNTCLFYFQNGWLTQLFDHDKNLLTTDFNLTSRQWRWLVWFRSHTSRNAIVIDCDEVKMHIEISPPTGVM